METLSEALPFRMEPGERFAGKYLVDRVLGRGGMAVVVAALHEALGQNVAIKILSVPKDLEPEAVTRFFREARAAAALRSEHIARVIDVGVDELERHYIVMEHLEGEDLGAILARERSLPIGTSVGYVLHACEAIAEAHSLGIIHRDLKPDNLFLTQRKDGAPLLKVLDFGVSKTTEATLVRDAASVSNNHSLLGTPLYMSPEQVRASPSIDGRSDLWSLGVILYELLTARQPFHGDTLADVIASVLTTEPVPPSALRPEIPEALSDLVLACLAKEPDDRLPSVGILARDLLPWAPRWARDAAARAARIAGATSLSPEETESFQLGQIQGEEGGQPQGPAKDPASGEFRTEGHRREIGKSAGFSAALPSKVAQAPPSQPRARDVRRRWLALLVVAGIGGAGVELLRRAKRQPVSPTAVGVSAPPAASGESSPRPDAAMRLPSSQAAKVEPPEASEANPAPVLARKRAAVSVTAVPKTTTVPKNSGIHQVADPGRMRPGSVDPLGSRR